MCIGISVLSLQKIIIGMDKDQQKKRDEALRRFKEAKRRKREYIEKIEVVMKREFKERTGQEATIFEVW